MPIRNDFEVICTLQDIDNIRNYLAVEADAADWPEGARAYRIAEHYKVIRAGRENK